MTAVFTMPLSGMLSFSFPRQTVLTLKRAAELNHSISEAIDQDSNDTLPDHDDDLYVDDPEEARLQRAEHSRFLMAKSFFDCREFDRCAVTLMPSLLPTQPVDRRAAPQVIARDSPYAPSKSKGKATAHIAASPLPTQKAGLSQRSMFLALYAKYLSGEKRKEEESEMVLGPVDGPITPNTELVKILGILERHFNQQGGLEGTAKSDGFLEYLYGVVLLKNKSHDYAQKWLLKSVRLYQWNWSAWQELATCVESIHQVCKCRS